MLLLQNFLVSPTRKKFNQILPNKNRVVHQRQGKRQEGKRQEGKRQDGKRQEGKRQEGEREK